MGKNEYNLSNFIFILIDIGTVNVSVANLQGMFHSSLNLARLRLPSSQTKYWHGSPTGQCQSWNRRWHDELQFKVKKNKISLQFQKNHLFLTNLPVRLKLRLNTGKTSQINVWFQNNKSLFTSQQYPCSMACTWVGGACQKQGESIYTSKVQKSFSFENV